ncbi:unnamed protein product, partial [Onchocerca ochengi]
MTLRRLCTVGPQLYRLKLVHLLSPSATTIFRCSSSSTTSNDDKLSTLPPGLQKL